MTNALKKIWVAEQDERNRLVLIGPTLNKADVC